ATSAASAAPPAVTASPSGPAPRSTAPNCPRTRPWPSPSTWPKAPACGPPVAFAASASTPFSASPAGPAGMPSSSTHNRCGTSRSTRCRWTRRGPSWEKKDKHCDPSAPADQEQGSYWDHVLLDADSRLLVTLVIGRRDTDTARQAFADFYRRTDGDLTPLITSDEYAPYLTVILETYGVPKEELERKEEQKVELELTEEQKVEYDYEGMPEIYFPVEMAYATVHKEREKGHVVRVEQRVVLGTKEQVTEALGQGATSETVNTSYVERYHGT